MRVDAIHQGQSARSRVAEKAGGRHHDRMSNAPGSLPILGAMTFEVLQASQTSLHGDVYFDLLVREAGNAAGEPHQLRVARDVCAIAPTPGAIVRASFLMGQVERITPAS